MSKVIPKAPVQFMTHARISADADAALPCSVNICEVRMHWVQVSVTIVPPEAEAAPHGAAAGPAEAELADPHAAARATLRARVVALTRAAAATGPESNEVECGKVRTFTALDQGKSFRSRRIMALVRTAAAAGPETNEVECGKVRTTLQKGRQRRARQRRAFDLRVASLLMAPGCDNMPACHCHMGTPFVSKHTESRGTAARCAVAGLSYKVARLID